MLSVFLGFAVALSGRTAPTVTIGSLLKEMADRSGIARLPEVPYKQLQATSYDRLKTDPNDSKTWFANKDYEQFIRTEQRHGKTEWVVMEHEGPGAITRIWTPLLSDKDKMLVRFYLDGSDEPVIEEPFNDLMRGKLEFKPPFAFISWPEPGVTDGVGSDSYFPIPFAKSCRVTLSEVPFYYAFSYRAYPADTHVESFSPSALAEAKSTVEAVGADLDKQPAVTGGKDSEVNLGPGREFVVRGPKGAHALTGLKLTFANKPDLQALRSLVVSMTFDGEPTVWCPVGEFFGCGVHDHPVWDRFRAVDDKGTMACVWPMPYERTGEIRIHNYGSGRMRLRVAAQFGPWNWDSRSMHFHGSWRNQYPLATRPMSDWNYLTATGSGIYVGDTLTVFSPAAGWYGEGDEKVYQDGEAFPSHIGTGTEDYYGFAWGMAEHYSSAYVAMPTRDLKGRENWMGYTTTSRIRGLDGILFHKSLRFDMEVWDWADCKVGYSAATFWYARPGATSNRTASPLDAAAALPEWSIGIKGAIECESMKVLSKSDEIKISTQSGALTDGSWSNNMQLFLESTQPGGKLALAFPVAKAGRCHVILYATRSYDYGIVRFSINGKFGKEVDLWSEKPVLSGPIDLGTFDLSMGDNVLSAAVTGTNPRSTGSRFYFGLDCVVLK